MALFSSKFIMPTVMQFKRRLLFLGLISLYTGHPLKGNKANSEDQDEKCRSMFVKHCEPHRVFVQKCDTLQYGH